MEEEMRQPARQLSADQPWDVVQAKWDELRSRPAYFRRLATSMRTRLQCCVDAAGGQYLLLRTGRASLSGDPVDSGHVRVYASAELLFAACHDNMALALELSTAYRLTMTVIIIL